MELRQYINNVLTYINADTLIMIQSSTGFTIGTGAKQIPTYITSTGYAQLQAVDNDLIEHIEGMNLQGTYKVLYISGQLYAAVRPEIKGGDLVSFNSETWLIVELIERWPTWCKVLICLQSP